MSSKIVLKVKNPAGQKFSYFPEFKSKPTEFKPKPTGIIKNISRL